MFTGTTRTRTFGRSDSMSSVSALMPRLGCETMGFKNQNTKSKILSCRTPIRHPIFLFKVLCFKNPLRRSRTKGMVTGAGGTLSERPDVRVRAAAVNMPFVRASRLQSGQVAGRPFFGSFLWSEQRNEQRKDFKKAFFVPFLSRQRKCTPKSEKATPLAFRVPTNVGIPSPGTLLSGST